MPTITFKNFRGINLKEGTWQQGFSKYAMGVDVLGVQDNRDTGSDGKRKRSIPGVIQGALVMNAGTEAAATNNITTLPTRFAFNGSVSGNVWALDNGLRLYERLSGSWTRRYSGAGVDFVAARNTTDGGGLLTFQDSLWVATNGDVNRVTAPTGGITAPYNDGTNNADFAATTSGPRPTIVFERQAYFGNQNRVSKLSEAATPIWTQSALTLDDEYVIYSMEVFNKRIWISADDGQRSRIFIWDGISTKVDDAFDIRDHDAAPYIIYFDGVLWALGRKTQFSPISVFDGSSFRTLFDLPITLPTTSVGRDIATTYRGKLIIGSTMSSNIADYEDGGAGVWMIGKKDAGEPYEAILYFNPANGVTESTMGGVFSQGDIIYVGTQNNDDSEYEIWERDEDDQNTGGIWSSNPIDGNPEHASDIKLWHSITLDTELDQDTYNVNRTVIISYKTDQESSFTTLATVRGSNSGANPEPHRSIPIGVSGRNIEIRLQLGAATGVDSTRVRGFKLEYTPTNGR